MTESDQSLEMKPAALDATRRFVRVTGERAGGFVEFDFAIGEPEIFAELILARDAFAEFCATNAVEFLAATETNAGEGTPDDFNWRLGDATHTRFR
ncbi:phenol hydroxylase subunit [Thauera phenolivorans]|uniref:phenol hydroxylase subunit n=1 Tax=Thauera phenolivorans TaxID=1792543 RepID=UPI000A4F39CB|nr:phenol hydroxylase subunit [Thauera phenolivorans]